MKRNNIPKIVWDHGVVALTLHYIIDLLMNIVEPKNPSSDYRVYAHKLVSSLDDFNPSKINPRIKKELFSDYLYVPFASYFTERKHISSEIQTVIEASYCTPIMAQFFYVLSRNYGYLWGNFEVCMHAHNISHNLWKDDILYTTLVSVTNLTGNIGNMAELGHNYRTELNQLVETLNTLSISYKTGNKQVYDAVIEDINLKTLLPYITKAHDIVEEIQHL
jgi:predicted nucleic-acid-binding protein